MNGILKGQPRAIVRAGVLAALALIALLGAAESRAASIYPAGGGAFNGSTEGWKLGGEPGCTIPLAGLCSATGGYDGASGQSAGSLAADTSILLNLGGLFQSSVVFESPDFVATEGGAGALHVDRAITSANLLDLAPRATYTVQLLDRNSGTGTVVLTESITAAENAAFGGKDAAVTLVQGRTYALSIGVETSSSLVGLGLMGSTAVNFDNVAVTVGSTGGPGGGGGGGGGAGAGGGAGGGPGGGGDGSGSGGGTLTDSALAKLAPATLVGSAALKGSKVFVKSKCVKKIGRACRVTVQGFLRKGKAATTKRTVRVAKGKTKRIVLNVKSQARNQVSKRKKLRFKQIVRAGGAKATVFKPLTLVKR